jgi:hypothetical protein
MKLTEGQVKIVEDWVNDEGAIKILEVLDEKTGLETIPTGWDRNDWVNGGRWNAWLEGLHKEVEDAGEPRLPNDFLDELVDDVADWEHNGNLYHWADDEVNNFGMGRWRIEGIGQ